MKITIAERRPDGSVVTIDIEPFGGAQAKTHSVKCSRSGCNGTISRFFLDSEDECWNFIRCLTEDRSTFIGISQKTIEVWEANNLNEVLA